MQSVPITTNVVSLNPAQVRCTRYKHDNVCQQLVTGPWFSTDTPVSSTNKTGEKIHTYPMVIWAQEKNCWTVWSMLDQLWLNFMKVVTVTTQHFSGPPWSRLYGSLIYNYLCNQCLSPLKLWVPTLFMVRCTHYNIKFVSDLWQVDGFLRV
jgi:hypothetical protein